MSSFTSVIKNIWCLFMTVVYAFCIPASQGASFLMNQSITIEIDEETEYNSFNGFGASACWWAQNCGGSEYADEVARRLYSKEGLALNIYRYNVGAGEADNPNGRVTGSRASESFYYYNEENGRYEYDFTRDAAAQAMLKKCLSYGCVDTVVLFANSPHYSMTVSGSAAGPYEEYKSNLDKSQYEAYADYFITITKHFINEGVPVKYISPINEPQWSWGSPDWVGQEGCHYEKEEAVELLRVFAKKIKASGLDVKLMGPESGELGETTEWYFNELTSDKDISSVLGSLAYHSYWSDNNYWGKVSFGEKILSDYQSYNVDMTEWCELPCEHSTDDFDGAMYMAKVITDDLNTSHVNSWSAWVGVNGYEMKDGKMYSDGLLVADDAFTELHVPMRYYAMAHFSKYIPSGSVGIYSNASRLLASGLDLSTIKYTAFKTQDGGTVLVIVNSGNALNIATGKLFGKMQVITSTETEQLKEIYSGTAKLFFECPANSITTVIYS